MYHNIKIYKKLNSVVTYFFCLFKLRKSFISSNGGEGGISLNNSAGDRKSPSSRNEEIMILAIISGSTLIPPNKFSMVSSYSFDKRIHFFLR